MDQIQNETQQDEPTFEKSVKTVMEELPPPIRSYVAQRKYSVVAKQLMERYGLHIDQAAILEREILLLLIGAESPGDFSDALTQEIGLERSSAAGIIKDVDERIFVPLQGEMRRGAELAAQAPRPQAPTQAQRPAVSPPPAVPSASAPAVRPSASALLPRSVAPLPPKGAMPRPQWSAARIPSVSLPNDRLLEDHEEPHIEFAQDSRPPIPPPPPAPYPTAPPRPAIAPLSPPPISRPSAPLPPFPVPPAPARAPVLPPENLPGAPVAAQPAHPRVAPPPAASYPMDPYREPIE